MAAMQSVAACMRTPAPVQLRQRHCLHSRGASAMLVGCSTRSSGFATGSRLSRREVRCSSSKPTSTTTDEPESAGDKSREDASSTAVSESAASSSPAEGASKEAVTEASMDSIGAEMARLRKAKEAADPSGAGGFALGVLEEVRLIEWPGFSSVLSTTGLVLAVIVSATIAILIVNAILSELSDKIFSIEAVADLWGL